MILSNVPCDLPGFDLIEIGLRDLVSGEITRESLLILIASPELIRLGLEIPPLPSLDTDAEIQLYRLIENTDPDNAHSAYNALIRRLVSFQNSLAHFNSAA